MKRMLTITVLAVLLVLNVGHLAQAGRIVVTNDEWMLSDAGFGSAGTQPGQFALNVAQWFTGSSTGNSFLVYSSNFGLTGSALTAVMTGAGNTWTITPTPVDPNPSLASLQAFDAVFIAGDAVNNATLVDYVNSGGNVFLEGGTGIGGSANEAARWQFFLNSFGLEFGTSYNGVGGNIPISSPHPIFAGVSALYQNNGNDTLDINASDLRGQVLVYSQTGAHGLYAVYDSGSTAVPEAATIMLLGLGLVGLTGMRSKLKKYM